MSGTVAPTLLCEVRSSRFRRCRGEVVAACQYCGRRFCHSHGSALADGQEVCSRRPCQAKMVDLARHLQYKEAVTRRNALGHCGIDGCQPPPWGQCSRCQGLFCEAHLHYRTKTSRLDGRLWRQPASMCDQCWQRQGVWSRL
ncbi:MAG: hypothetical protein ACE5IZ_05320 [Dehalococcoidia bacterium]